MGLAQAERAALADFLEESGPDLPTLCDGWTTGDLLVHLLIRERRPDGVVGMLIPALAGYTARVGDGFRTLPWVRQVRAFRDGPPLWNPMGWGPLGELANAAELFIHHEDARRGVPGWAPRALDAATNDALADLVASLPVRMHLRRSPVGISAVIPGRPTRVLHAGTPVVQVCGAPGEVLLWATGRSAVQIDLHGDPDAVRAVQGLARRM